VCVVRPGVCEVCRVCVMRLGCVKCDGCVTVVCHEAGCVKCDGVCCDADTEKQVDCRMNLSARFPTDAWKSAQVYFTSPDTSLTHSVC